MIGELIPINLAQESYQSRSSLSSCTRVYNMYAENTLATSPFKTPALFNTANPNLWLDLGIYNEVYGFIEMNNFLYAVCGVKLFKINSNKVITEIGELGTSPDIVQMTENGLQVTILTSSGISYYYTESTDTFGQITDPNYLPASSVCTIDGYTIFSEIGSGRFFVSDLRDTTTYPATYRATAEALSDNIVRLVAFNNQLYIFGTASVEIWQSTGVGDPPFQRINGAFFQQGINAKGSVIVDVSGIYFLGNDGIFYKVSAYNPERVSTFGIEEIISKMIYTDDALALIYTQAGHKFAIWNFLREEKTIILDIVTGLWHERGSFNNSGSAQQRWSCLFAINYNKLVIVNCRVPGRLCFLDPNKYDEEGQAVLAEIITSLIFKDYNNFSINNLVLVVDSGVGLEYPNQGFDPKIMMDFSTDGGLTWTERSPQPMGKIGKYRQRINWTNLGSAREFVLRFRISDPVKRSILAAYVQITDGGF
jgi:hypothetical protein